MQRSPLCLKDELISAREFVRHFFYCDGENWMRDLEPSPSIGSDASPLSGTWLCPSSRITLCIISHIVSHYRMLSYWLFRGMKQPKVNIYNRKRGNFLMCMYSTDNVGKIEITKKKEKAVCFVGCVTFWWDCVFHMLKVGSSRWNWPTIFIALAFPCKDLFTCSL